MSERKEVYEAINEERNYQDNMRGNSARVKVGDNRDLGSLITLMDVYLGKTKIAFAGPHPNGKTEALDVIRKVVALGVLAMELHGVVRR